MRKLIAILGFALALCGSAHAQAGQVRLAGLDEAMAGPRAQVLVLGSVHLNERPKDFGPTSLEPLLTRLAAFRPDIITIESLSGEDCQRMALYPDVYWPEFLGRYCFDTATAQAATGLDVPAASAEADRVLDAWPVQPTATQRRHLAALFLASGDPASALVQWLQLPEPERRPGDGLDAALVEILDTARTRRGEGYQVAAALAARLGLQRVYPADDHTGDTLDLSRDEVEAYGKALSSAWDAAAAGNAPYRERSNALLEQGDMLALYRHINRAEVLQAKVEADFAAALADPSPQHYGQRYVAGWETRNLRMVAHVRAAFRYRPGARVLSIVGSTHKPWFDTLLGQMQGVDIVDVETVLGPDPDR